MSLYGDKTYEKLLSDALSRVDSALDRREGSMVYNGIAPSMAELAQLYMALDYVFTASYIETAPREYLILRAKDRGMTPKAASAATYRAEFSIEVPIGSRYSCDAVNFVATERMPEHDTDSAVSYKIVCEALGEDGNNCSGDLIPIDYLPGLAFARIAETLTPGEDEEDTEVFRHRVLEATKNQSFGGNQADYREKVLGISGVAAIKVHPVWNADISPASLIPSESVQTWYASTISGISDASVKAWLTSVYTAALGKKLTVGGTVKIVIMASGNVAPSETLIDEVQTIIDPTQNAGEGMGLAPIGHVVTVRGVTAAPITVSASLSLTSGYTWDDIKPFVDAAIKAYLADLTATWADSDALIVRVARLESRILTDCVKYVTDVSGTTINGKAQNLMLDADSIPVLSDGGITDAG